VIRIAFCLAALLLAQSVPAEASNGLPSIGDNAPGPDQTATCTDIGGPGIPAPAGVVTGLPGYHAAFFGQSGYPVLCPGHTATATVAFLNNGSLGWFAGKMGAAAFLGTWGPDPGQDKPSILGTDAGWPAPNRIASQPAAYIGPGQVSWFQFTVRAPQTPGVYRLGIRPLVEGAQWLEDQGVFWNVTVKASDADVVAAPMPTVAPPTPVTAAPRPIYDRTYFPAIGSDGARSFYVNALMYHYVSWLPPDPDAVRTDLTVSPTDFEDHLKYLKANGYHTITAKDLWWSLDTGKPLPPKPVLLTFDDGYVDHHDVVMPLLRAYGMTGTFAVTANLIDRPGYMTKAMVRALADSGMDVESHAVDHYSINRLGYTEQLYQLCTSRRILSEWTGTDVRHFIFPSGDWLPLPSAALTACGYLSAYRKDGGSVESSNEMLALRRVRVRGQQGLSALLFALQQ
jgi:peptidoglycan/xylan/chitin deacetylase (PgdA/CDA1 family)